MPFSLSLFSLVCLCSQFFVTHFRATTDNTLVRWIKRENFKNCTTAREVQEVKIKVMQILSFSCNCAEHSLLHKITTKSKQHQACYGASSKTCKNERIKFCCPPATAAVITWWESVNVNQNFWREKKEEGKKKENRPQEIIIENYISCAFFPLDL